MLPTSSKPIAVWLEPSQVEFVRRAARCGGLEIGWAGSPVKGQSSLVAAGLGVQGFDDLRAFLAETQAPLVWLACGAGLGTGPADLDARAVNSAWSRGVRIATTEPIPTSVLDLAPGGWVEMDGGRPVLMAGERLRLVSAPALSRPWREAQEVLAAFGSPRLVQIEAWSGPGEGTLAARLLGAMDLVIRLIGEPESINAAYVGPVGTTGLVSVPGQTLADLHGDLSVTMRTQDGRAAVLAASNAAGRWCSVVTLIGATGRLRFYDDGFEWIGPDGARRDEQRLSHRTRGATDLADTGARVAGDALARLLDPAIPDPGPIALEAVLVLCQTALLSARTRNPESPESIRRMMLV